MIYDKLIVTQKASWECKFVHVINDPNLKTNLSFTIVDPMFIDPLFVPLTNVIV